MRKKSGAQQRKAKNELIDQLESYLSETVPSVAASIEDAVNKVFDQGLDKTVVQAEQYFLTTALPKAEKKFEEIKKSSKQMLTSAYNKVTKENIKQVASSAVKYVKDHPYTTGALAVGAFTSRYISPELSLAAGLCLIGKVVYDNGELNFGFDSDYGKVGVKARIGKNRK